MELHEVAAELRALTTDRKIRGTLDLAGRLVSLAIEQGAFSEPGFFQLRLQFDPSCYGGVVPFKGAFLSAINLLADKGVSGFRADDGRVLWNAGASDWIIGNLEGMASLIESYSPAAKTEQSEGKEIESIGSTTPTPCPTCNGPRTPDEADRLCEKCRSIGKPKEVGSLLELRTTLESKPDFLNDLTIRGQNATLCDDWRKIRSLGCSRWGESFDPARTNKVSKPQKPLETLVDSLVESQNKREHEVLFMQRSEVIELLRAETEKKGVTAATTEQSEGNDGKAGNWITVAEANRLSKVDKGVISRAATNGAFTTNGKQNRERRIDLPSFHKWVLQRSPTADPVVLPADVEKRAREARQKRGVMDDN